LTSLDKYQIVNIVYLAVCCLWHSINLTLIYPEKNFNSIALLFFTLLFVLIQLVFAINLIRLYKKIKQKEKEEKTFLLKLAIEKENQAKETEKKI
jgi:uncharacterized protein YhhL (DUF1145 family)